MERERKQRQHSRAHGNKDWTDSSDSRFDERAPEWGSAFVLFFDEIEQDNHMAHDHADEARDAENREKAHRPPGQPQTGERADGAERNAGEHDERLEGIPELE